MLGRIVVYSVVGCPHCVRAKTTLKQNGLEFTEVGVDRFPAEIRNWLIERTGKTSVPQIFFNERLIGGAEELHALVVDEERFQKEIE
jgi:glutaredoxin